MSRIALESPANFIRRELWEDCLWRSQWLPRDAFQEPVCPLTETGDVPTFKVPFALREDAGPEYRLAAVVGRSQPCCSLGVLTASLQLLSFVCLFFLPQNNYW